MKWTRPENWEQFGKIFDALINSGVSIVLDVLNPNSDDPWYTVTITSDAILKIVGEYEVEMASTDLFQAMADAANKALDNTPQTGTLFP